jgi:hypothetical protein
VRLFDGGHSITALSAFSLFFVKDQPHFRAKMVVRLKYNIQHANDDSIIFIPTVTLRMRSDKIIMNKDVEHIQNVL